MSRDMVTRLMMFMSIMWNSGTRSNNAFSVRQKMAATKAPAGCANKKACRGRGKAGRVMCNYLWGGGDVDDGVRGYGEGGVGSVSPHAIPGGVYI